MNGIHDLGGMHGFGAVVREPNEPVFHARWEGRVWALEAFTMMHGLYNVDEFRHSIETMPPDRYLSVSYYARWLYSLETLLVRHGAVRPEELEARLRSLGQPPAPSGAGESRDPNSADGADGARAAKPPLTPLPAARPDAAGKGFLRPGAAEPAFSVGDRVRARNLQPAGHTRLPGYARGRRGVVVRVHPPCVFPDTHAHGLGEQPQCVYNVAFEASELFGEVAEPRSRVHLDLFESYLEEAS